MPPLLLNPKPWPRAPVTDGVLPVAGSGVDGGLRADVAAVGRDAGCGTGTTAFGSAGRGASGVGAGGFGLTGAGAAPPICVSPPVRSPGAPLRLTVITCRRGSGEV